MRPGEGETVRRGDGETMRKRREKPKFIVFKSEIRNSQSEIAF